MYSRYKWTATEMNNLMDCIQCEDHPQYTAYKNSRQLAKKFSYTWLPLGISENEIQKYTKFHKVCSNDERCDIITKSMPLTDVNTKRSNHLTSYEKKIASGIIKGRNYNDVGLGIIKIKRNSQILKCQKCSASIADRGYYVIPFENHGSDKIWCIECFRCQDCNINLPDHIYYLHQNKIHCLRHYGEKFRPRCAACDELIYGDEYTKAMQKNFHLDHFICHSCNICLTEEKYVVKKDHAYCLGCYDDQFAQICYACNDKIRCKDKGLSFKNWFWHEECFKCKSCDTKLSGSPFAIKDNTIFCSGCYEKSNTIFCDGCHEVFEAGTRTFEFRNKRWHEHCFLCDDCHIAVGTNNFIPSSDNTPICLRCHEKKSAPKCYKCNEPIISTGVTYKGSTWHSSCFICGSCKNELVGCKFTMKNEIPYCGECYGKHFAKRCGKCHQPISGFNGDQFVIFENVNYHSRCFNCCHCDTSLIYTGFVSSGDSFVCPTCARNGRRLQANSTGQDDPSINPSVSPCNSINNRPIIY